MFKITNISLSIEYKPLSSNWTFNIKGALNCDDKIFYSVLRDLEKKLKKNPNGIKKNNYVPSLAALLSGTQKWCKYFKKCWKRRFQIASYLKKWCFHSLAVLFPGSQKCCKYLKKIFEKKFNKVFFWLPQYINNE